MLCGESAPENELLCNRVTDAIARYRKLLFILVAILYILSFNGRWRLGLDSANYRGLALNIASGKGYTFGDWAPKQLYPGLPYSLAAIEGVLGPADRTPSLAEQHRLLGPSPATTASVLFILATALITLVVVYRLIRLYYPTWVAVTITCGVATNAVFLQYSQELMTDVPFLCGLMISLYGWELLKRARGRKATLAALAVVAPGLLLTATMRPMFWVVAGCWAAVCVWGLIRRGQRRFYAICLGLLLFTWVLFTAIDPRSRGFHPFSGGYEREAIELLPRTLHRFSQQLYYILHDQLPAAMFGEQLAPFSIVGSLIVLGSTLLLIRRHLLWVLLVFGTVAVTLPLSSEPRYYTMVLPIMLLGWLVLFCWLARRVPRVWGEVILIAALSIVTLNNLSASVGFLIEQHRSDYLKRYKHGEYATLLEMCEQIRQHVEPGKTILGPSGSIMSIFTGVHVLTQRELLPKGPDIHSPTYIARAKVDYVIVPGSLYLGKESAIGRMIGKRIIRAQRTIATVKGMRLATMVVHVPPGDWRKTPKRAAPGRSQPVASSARKRSPATAPAARVRSPAPKPGAAKTGPDRSGPVLPSPSTRPRRTRR